MGSTKQAVFYLDNSEYGMDIMDVNTIEKSIAVEQVANTPKNIKGLIHLRGDAIPVYSLRSKFGMEEKQPDQDTRLMITNSNGFLIAYEVDKMLGITNIMSEQVNDVPPILKSKSTTYLKQVINVDGRLIILLDRDGILTEEELNSLKKIAKAN